MSRESALERLVGEQAHGIHDVAEIQTGCLGLDRNFSLPRSPAGAALPMKILERARSVEIQNEAFAFTEAGGACLRLGNNAAGQASGSVEKNFILAVIANDLRG